jgi:hypothetical protein
VTRSSRAVLVKIAVSPQRSVKEIISEIVLPKSRPHRITQRHKFHPDKIHFVQELHGYDTGRLFQLRECPTSLRIRADDIAFSDEACFHFNGYVNRHNTVYWVQDNSQIAVDAYHHTNPRKTVWCAIHGNTPGGRSERQKISPVVEWSLRISPGWYATHSTTPVLLLPGRSTTSCRWRDAKLNFFSGDGLGARDQSNGDYNPRTSHPYTLPLWSSEVTCLPYPSTYHCKPYIKYPCCNYRRHSSGFRTCAM